MAARHLRAAGWPVRVGLLGAPQAPEGRRGVGGAVVARSGRDAVSSACSRPAVGDRCLVRRRSQPAHRRGRRRGHRPDQPRRVHVVAVDVPSGLHGDSGEVMGGAPFAERTVTFFRAKPGHYSARGLAAGAALLNGGRHRHAALRPGGDRAAPVAERIRRCGVRCCSAKRLDDHKYARGHLTILGGATATGAARLAALAARRAGAGLGHHRHARGRPWRSTRRPSRQPRGGVRRCGGLQRDLLRGSAAQCDADRSRLGHQSSGRASAVLAALATRAGRRCSTPMPSPCFAEAPGEPVRCHQRAGFAHSA